MTQIGIRFVASFISGNVLISNNRSLLWDTHTHMKTHKHSEGWISRGWVQNVAHDLDWKILDGPEKLSLLALKANSRFCVGPTAP